MRSGAAREDGDRAGALSVGVLVTLERGIGAGGHVKCWERFAEAAAALDSEGEGGWPPLDLTLYTLGRTPHREVLSPRVRVVSLTPALGTRLFPFLAQGAGHTDLAPRHPRLARLLKAHHVLHATDTFSFSQTARGLARKPGGPALVASLHTDLPAFTRVYAREIIGRITGQGLVGRLVMDDLAIPALLGRNAETKVRRFLAGCDRVLVSKSADRDLAASVLPATRISSLRRGIDLRRFHPDRRNRKALARRMGIPDDRPLLLFVGRVDDSKRVMTLARAARLLLDMGHPLHVLVIGSGGRHKDVVRLLGPNVTAPGGVPQTQLPVFYASADLFVFPSESDVSPNVVLEARACGLPVVVSARDGGAQFVRKSGEDGVLVDDPDPGAWARALAPLVADDARCVAMGLVARDLVETHSPSWTDVLLQDLMPVWTAARAAAQARAAALGGT